MPRKSEVDDAREALLARSGREGVIPARDLLGTGSTLLNLALTGKYRGGFAKGKYFFVVGDTSSGKTFLTLTCLAEASINPEFDKHSFVYDNAEDGALMPIRTFFGEGVFNRLQPPARDRDGNPVYSSTHEDFELNLHAWLDSGPCIYVLDSMDALSTRAEMKKSGQRRSVRSQTDVDRLKGDYGDGKAKLNSRLIRTVLPKLRDTGSILIIINQTRDNVKGGPFEPKKTRSGGHALSFYATVEIWSSVGRAIKRKVRGIDRNVGVRCKIRVKKNRLTGRDSRITIPIYYNLGIDDIGSCVDYLISEKHWSRNKEGAIVASEFGYDGKVAGLIQKIEEDGLENDLRDLVAEVWAEVLRETEIPRKPRYG